MIWFFVLAVVCLFVSGFFAVISEGKAEHSGFIVLASFFGWVALMFAYGSGVTSFQEYPTNQPVKIAPTFRAGEDSYYIVKWGSSYAVVKETELAPKAKITVEVGQTYIITDDNGAYKVEAP